MRVGQAGRNLDRDVDGFDGRQRSLSQTIGEGLSLDELHHEEVNVFLVPDVEHHADVRMVQL
jgi:hypothetical protein